METDLSTYTGNKPAEFQMTIDGRLHNERIKAAEHFMVRSRKLGRNTGDTLDMGSYAGFPIRLIRHMGDGVGIQLCGKCTYTTDLGESELGNITRIENRAERVSVDLEVAKDELVDLNRQLEAARLESEKPFTSEEKLVQLQRKKVELDLALEFKDTPDPVLEPDEDNTDVMNYEPDGEDGVPVRTAPPSAQLTLEQRLYQKLAVFASPILEGEAYYMTAEWTVLYNGEITPLTSVLEGKLTNEGGTVRFKQKGTFTLKATLIDALGREYSHGSKGFQIGG